MKIKEIRTLPDDEINSEIEKAREKIFKMRFQAKGEAVESPGSLKSTRRHIARLKTVLAERRMSRLEVAESTAGKEGEPS